MNAHDLLLLAQVDWDDAAQKLTLEERRALALELEALTEYAARAAAYFDERTQGTGNPNAHARAVKAQNRVGAKVRKALGYSVCQDVSF